MAQPITYFDGLGRPIEKIGVNQGGEGKDLVSILAYDAFGRQPRQYLPYVVATTNKGAFLTPAESSVTGYYTGKPGKSGNPFTDVSFENSPLNRPLSQKAPGATATAQMAYRTNTATDNVPLLTYDFATGQITASTYGANQLYVTLAAEERGNSTGTPAAAKYKDKEGRVVCKNVADLRMPTRRTHNRRVVVLPKNWDSWVRLMPMIKLLLLS